MSPDSATIEVFESLRSEVRHFLDDGPLDRVGFVRLTRILHDLSLPERKVAYDYLLRSVLDLELGASDPVRARALARLSDLVAQEPPEIGTHFGAQLRAVA